MRSCLCEIPLWQRHEIRLCKKNFSVSVKQPDLCDLVLNFNNLPACILVLACIKRTDLFGGIISRPDCWHHAVLQGLAGL